MMDGYGPSAEEPVVRNMAYYDEQIRVLRERTNALEREMETLRRHVEDHAGASGAAQSARLERLESRVEEVERGRRADRAVIVDEVVAEIDALLRGSTPSSPPTRSGEAADGTYVVQSGDTLWSIARRLGTSVEDLQRANGLSATSIIREGQTLVVP
jgi:LysM repeat protein